MKEHDALPLPDRMDYPHSEMIDRAQAFYEEMRKRHTVREFSDRPVPREVIEYAVKAAGTAPSGANHQPWYFSIIGSAELKKELRERAEAEERAFYSGKAGNGSMPLRPWGLMIRNHTLRPLPGSLRSSGNAKAVSAKELSARTIMFRSPSALLWDS